MKKDWKYIALFGGALLIILIIRAGGPRELSWEITFHPEDKNPYGGAVLNRELKEIFPEGTVNSKNLTLFEMYDSVESTGNLLIICMNFSPGDADRKVLMKNVAEGANAFIAAEYYDNAFADTLRLGTSDYFFDDQFEGIFTREDTSKIIFKNKSLKHPEPFLYPRKNVHNYFDRYDTANTVVMAVNDLNLPVLIRTTWGKGNIYLSTTPLAFSNIYLLQKGNEEFAAHALSHLPDDDVQWMAYYQVGRMETSSPFRFILTTEPLTWAYYIVAAAILLFMLFEARRRQRIIPIIKPLENTTLEFVHTVGNLYLQHNDHKNIAEKKITYLLEYIRQTYFLPTALVDEAFLKNLSRKSGHPPQKIQALFGAIKSVQASYSISADDLIRLNEMMEEFYG